MDSRIESFKVNWKTIVYSYIVQFFQYCTSLLVLPFILTSVDSSTLGVWYVFLSVAAVKEIIDFGFSASLSRNISFVFSGAKEILKDGTSVLSENKKIDYNLLFSLVKTSKETYAVISLIMLFVLLLPGSYYISSVVRNNGLYNIFIIWFFFSLSLSLNYYLGYILIFVKGRGKIELYNSLILISKISYICLVVLLLRFNFGLWALVIANTLSSLIMLIVGHIKFWDKNLLREKDRDSNNEHYNLFSIIWFNAKKYGLTSLTTYGFSQVSVLLAGAFLTVSDVAKYGLLMQLCNAILSCGRVFINSCYPKICSLWVINDIRQIKSLFLKSQVLSYLIWAIGFFVLIFGGNYILNLMQSKTDLPERTIIILYSFFYLMEFTHGNCSLLISSNNTVPFYKAAIYACVTSIILMIFFLKLGWGMISFPLAVIAANLPYNSWKWPYEAYRLLKTRSNI